MNPGGSAGASGSIPPSPASASAGGVGRSLSSSSSASAAAISSSLQQVAEDNLFAHLADDLTFTHDGKLETQQALMEELLDSLRKEEKILDADAWKYAAPRSQLYLTSMSGVRLAKGELSAFGNKEVKGEQHLVRTCFTRFSSRISVESKQKEKALPFWEYRSPTVYPINLQILTQLGCSGSMESRTI